MKIFKPRPFHYASAIALSLGMMSPMVATAQDSETDAQEEELKQETIYVTARKREESQLEVPVSVSAFSQAALDERGISDVSELSDFVPGFDFENVGTGGASGRANPQIRFRGVGVQIGDANARAGAVFWDGAFVPDGIGIVPLLDLERTEVIKGPQTAFYGRNTFAGAANFIPSRADDDYYVRLSGGLTTTDVDDGNFLNAIVNVPFTEDLSARVAISHEERGGAFEFQDGSALGAEDTFAVLGSLNYDVSDSLNLRYSGYFVESEDTAALSSINGAVAEADCDVTYEGNLRDIATGEDLGAFSTDLSNLPGPVFDFGTLTFFAADATLFCGEIPEFGGDDQLNPVFGGPPPVGSITAGFESTQVLPTEFGGNFIDAPNGLGNTYETWRHHFAASQEFDNGMSLAGFVSAGNNQNWGIFDTQYGLVNAATGQQATYAGFIRETEDISAEVRFTSSDEERFRWMVGANYYTQDAQNYQIQFNILTEQEAEVLGLFAAVDFDITDEITISGEGRLQDDESTLVFDGPAGMDIDFDEQSQSFTRFMPRAILRYQPADTGLNIYGSWSQSYLPGTQTGATSFAAATNGAINPDNVGFFTPIQKLSAFEVGLKHDFSDLLDYSVAAYRMDWSNQAFFVLSPTFVSVSLPGDSEYTGVEGEVNINPTDWFSIQASYNWVNAEFTDYVATGSVGAAVLAPGLLNNTTAIDATGNAIRYIPEHTGAIGFDFNFSDYVGRDSFVRVDTIFTGSFFTDNFEFNEVDAGTRVNFRAGIGLTDSLKAEVFGTNVFDDGTVDPSGGTTFTSFFSQNTRRFFGQAPRGSEWGFRLTAEFE